MKNLSRNLGAFLLLLIMFSCGDDSEKSTKDPSLNEETISGKWEVSSSTARTNAGYLSFEFNTSGSFIVLLDDDIIFGSYNIIDDETIELEDFGTITIISIDDDSIEFTLTLIGGTEITFECVKAEEMDLSSNTEKLCRTWRMVSIDGDNVAGTDDELTILFSAAGTYFISNTSTSEIGQWKWKNSGETVLCYSWDGAPTCTGDNEVLVEVTSTKLKVTEDGTVFVLELANGSRKASPGSVTPHALKKGLFRK